MEGPTVAQAKLAAPESLWHFILSLPATIEGQIVFLAVASSMVGLFANYVVKWAKGEIAGSLWCYLFHSNVRRTVLSFCSSVGAAIGLVSVGAFEPAGVFIGWKMTAFIGAQTGYFLDSAVNKGERKEWTPSERAVREAVAIVDEPVKEKT